MAILTAAPTRRKFSVGFKVFLGVLLALLIGAGVIFGIGAARNHASVDRYGRYVLVYALEDIAKSKAPLKDVLVPSVDTNSNSYQILIRFPKITKNDFVMQLVTSDDYTWTYDSSTGERTGACANLACFVGIHTQGPLNLGY